MVVVTDPCKSPEEEAPAVTYASGVGRTFRCTGSNRGRGMVTSIAAPRQRGAGRGRMFRGWRRWLRASTVGLKELFVCWFARGSKQKGAGGVEINLSSLGNPRILPRAVGVEVPLY